MDCPSCNPPSRLENGRAIDTPLCSGIASPNIVSSVIVSDGGDARNSWHNVYTAAWFVVQIQEGIC
jgi:hypothetical protein